MSAPTALISLLSHSGLQEVKEHITLGADGEFFKKRVVFNIVIKFLVVTVPKYVQLNYHVKIMKTEENPLFIHCSYFRRVYFPRPTAKRVFQAEERVIVDRDAVSTLLFYSYEVSCILPTLLFS